MENEKENLNEEEINIDEENIENEQEDEFELDEEGNIIIPEVVYDEDETDEDIEIETEEEIETGESSEEETSTTEEEVKPVENEKDKKIAELEKKLSNLEKQGKETLSKLGLKNEDVLEGLESLAAEAEDVSLEDYKKAKLEKEQTEEAKKLAQKTEFEKKALEDLTELQKYYPETKNFSSIFQIENLSEFGKFRDLGLSAKQAYAAANPDGVKKQVAEAVRQQSINATKEHLKSNVPKGSKDNTITMSKKEFSEWKGIFPKLSDKEIFKLYKASK